MPPCRDMGQRGRERVDAASPRRKDETARRGKEVVWRCHVGLGGRVQQGSCE